MHHQQLALMPLPLVHRPMDRLQQLHQHRRLRLLREHDE
jgi:hypothetical protein